MVQSNSDSVPDVSHGYSPSVTSAQYMNDTGIFSDIKLEIVQLYQRYIAYCSSSF